MDIRELDEAAVADDAVLREFYEINRRAELLGREAAPFWPFHEFLASVRRRDPGVREQLFATYDGDRMVATAKLRRHLLDNTDKASCAVNVDVPYRRRGIGRAVLERLEQMAKDDHRQSIVSETTLPFAERETHGYLRFAEVCGYQLANYEVARHLSLPVPDATVQGWIDEAAAHHEGYSVETYVDEVPDELVDSLCQLMGQLAVDAPTGEVDYEPEVLTRERFAAMSATVRSMGRAPFETVALTSDREVVAQSTLVVPLAGSTTVYQWGTMVHREHRGHRLGLATKAANLRAVQAFRDDLTLVTTQNAETNDHMVAINEKMGFQPVEVAVELVKRL